MTTILINFGYLIAIAVFALFGFVVGEKIWKAFKLPEPNKIEKIIINTVLGWGVTGYLIWLIGLTGINLIFSIYLITFLIAILTIARIKNLSHLFKIKIPKFNLTQGLILFACACFILISLIGALAPERAFDATWYHLPEARWFLQNNSTRTIYPSILDSSSVAPRLPEILFMWLMAFDKNEFLPHLLQWLSMIGMGLATYAIARRFTTRTNALLALLLLLSSREILWLATNAYVDNIYGLFGSAVCLAIFVFSENLQKKNHRSFAIIIGVLAGLMFATKMQALVFIPVIALGVLAAGKNIKSAIWTTVIALAVVFPWYLEIWLTTGNPLTAIAVAPPGDEHLGGGKSFWEWIFKIHPKTFLRDGLNNLKASFQIGVLALIPFLFWKKLTNKFKILMLATLFGWLGWTYVPVHLVRYMAPIFPLMAVVAAVSFDYIGRLLKPILLLAIMFIVIFNFATIYNYNRGVMKYVLGGESKHQLMTRLYKNNIFTFYDYDGVVEKMVKSGKVLGMIHNSFFVPVKYSDAVAFAAKHKTLDSADEIYQQLDKEEITHILTYFPYSIDSVIDQMNISDEAEKLKFKEKITIVYSNESGANLYEIK